MTKYKTYIIIAITIVSLCVVSCATILGGTDQPITIDSNVRGAMLQMDGMNLGQTPFTGNIKRDKDPIVTISHPGYQSEQLVLSSTLRGLVAVNIITGGPFGTTTDFASGAAWEYSPNTYYVNLRPSYQTQNDFIEESQIRYFAMLNHSQVAIDANASNGEYMLALADLMGSKMDREEAIDTIRTALAVSDGYQLTFGDELVKSFREHN